MEKNQQTRILVTGATGRQGGAAARHLLAGGFSVSALTRDPGKAQAHLLSRKGAEIVKGNLEDRSSLDRALKGVYGVFAVQDYWEHKEEGEIREGRLLLEAAKAAQVRHFVYSSVASADRNTGLAHFESKRVLEEALRASGMPYTILRPVFFMENFDANRSEILEQGVLRLPLPPDRKLQMIATHDIGAFTALAFSEPETLLGRTLEIAGAELTPLQMAEVFSEILGKPVRFEEVPLASLRESNPEVHRMFSWFRDKGYGVDVPRLRARYPFLRTFGEWLRETGWNLEGDTGPASHEALQHSESPMLRRE